MFVLALTTVVTNSNDTSLFQDCCCTPIAMSRQAPVPFDDEAYEYVLIGCTDSYPTNHAVWEPLSWNNVRLPIVVRYCNKRFFEVDMEDLTIDIDRSNPDPAYLYKTLLSRTSPDIMLVRKLQRVSLVVTLDYQFLLGVGTSSWSLLRVTATGLSGAIIHTMDFRKTVAQNMRLSVILEYT